jgi:hypothetical protein
MAGRQTQCQGLRPKAGHIHSITSSFTLAQKNSMVINPAFWRQISSTNVNEVKWISLSDVG